MNHSIVRYILGFVLKIEGILMFLPCVIALIFREHVGLKYIYAGSLVFLLGFALGFRKPKQDQFNLKEGCVATALSWIALSAFGAVPFVLTGEIPNYLNALFETTSGFTTTGASILYNVEALSHASLFWRSFTHWVGGMGVLVFLLAVIPMSGGGSINLMRAESPGPSVGKLVPKMKENARLLYYIYIGLSVAEFLLLLLGRMNWFDSLTIMFGTAGTGGFGVLNDSCASYTEYQQWVIAIFMMLFGVNFNAYYLILFRKLKLAFSMEEIRAYFVIIFASTSLITIQLIRNAVDSAEAIRGSFFTVSSIITTTGFATLNFNEWDSVSKSILVCLMFMGACAGSTGGGIKVSRVLLMLKTVKKELLSFIHPKSVRKIMLDDRVVEHEVLRATNVFFITYALLFVVSVLLIAIDGNDLVTNFTSVVASLSNIGPGLGKVGPDGNFAFFSPFSKIVLIFDMIAGRLELFPMLILMMPLAWREGLRRKNEVRQ